MSQPTTGNDQKNPQLNNIIVQNYPELPKVSSPNGSGSQSPLSAADKYHMDEIIPTKHSNRTIILCFDGTGDQFDEDVRIIVRKQYSQLTLSPILPRIPISFSSSPC